MQQHVSRKQLEALLELAKPAAKAQDEIAAGIRRQVATFAALLATDPAPFFALESLFVPAPSDVDLHATIQYAVALNQITGGGVRRGMADALDHAESVLPALGPVLVEDSDGR